MDKIIEKVLLRGSTAKEAGRNNVLLLAKEIGIETDTYKMKLGNGKSKWNDLPYLPFSVITKSLIDAWNVGANNANLFQTSVVYNITASDIARWNTALQVETDPVFLASPAAGITLTDIVNWNTVVTPTPESDIIAYAIAL